MFPSTYARYPGNAQRHSGAGKRTGKRLEQLAAGRTSGGPWRARRGWVAPKGLPGRKVCRWTAGEEWRGERGDDLGRYGPGRQGCAMPLAGAGDARGDRRRWPAQRWCRQAAARPCPRQSGPGGAPARAGWAWTRLDHAGWHPGNGAGRYTLQRPDRAERPVCLRQGGPLLGEPQCRVARAPLP